VNLPAYAHYKPSGIEWLGDVPEHWAPIALRRVSTRYTGGTPDRSNDLYWDEGTIPWINSGAVNQGLITEPSAYITEDGYRNSSARWVAKGAIVMALAGQGKTKGIVAQTGIATTCNQSMAAICPSPVVINPRYLFWLLVSQYAQIRNMAGGEARDGLNLEILGSIPCLKFPLAEQDTIVRFLDRETARIDRLVAKKRELIERLKEKRTALISRTVTRGLPPAAARAAGLPENPALKPSGLDWLGDIPAHWDVVPYKRVCTRVDVGIAEAATHAYCDDGIPLIRSTNVKPNRLDTSDVLRIEPWFAAKNRSKTLRAGDLVTVRTGYPGTTAMVPSEFDGSQCFTLVLSSPKRDTHGAYFSWVLNSRPGATYFEMEGWGTAQTNISVPIVQFMPVPHPPLAEQQIIAEFLNIESSRVDALVAKVETAIERLQEYRSALITAAVTGKIDVTGAGVA
jgi:type I restriction enzyme, S subunit